MAPIPLIMVMVLCMFVCVISLLAIPLTNGQLKRVFEIVATGMAGLSIVCMVFLIHRYTEAVG
jgi:hypothetical protein